MIRITSILYFMLLVAIFSCSTKVKTNSKEIKLKTPDSIKLAITLTKPDGLKTSPLIILIHGSGNDSRANEYYQLLTKEFCSIGFSVITYDKRGCDSSTGNWLSVPFSYLKEDVLSIVDHFSQDSSFNQIGLWGGSEGSNVAIWAASENKEIDFVIAQSFTSMTFAEQNKFVKLNQIKNYSNVSQLKINELMQLQDLLYEYVRTGQGYTEYLKSFNSFRDEEWFADILFQPISKNSLWARWYSTKLDIQNVEFLKNIRIPILFIWGQNDALIEVNKSKEMAMSIKQDSNFQFKIFNNAEHSLYGGGRKPVHLKFMKDWLQKTLELK